MAKVTKEQLARLEGMKYAYEFVKNHSVEELKKEIDFRGATNLPFSISKQSVIDFEEETKQRIISTVMLMSVLVLREEFGFGEKRIDKFSNKFEENSNQLLTGDLTWRDTYEAMVEEVGFRLNIDDEILNIKAKN